MTMNQVIRSKRLKKKNNGGWSNDSKKLVRKYFWMNGWTYDSRKLVRKYFWMKVGPTTIYFLVKNINYLFLNIL